MSNRLVASKPEPVKRARKPKATQTPQPVRKTSLMPRAEADEPAGDWWAAAHLTLDMLATVLKRYAANEGQWHRRDVQADLLQAQALIRDCLARGSSSVNTIPSA